MQYLRLKLDGVKMFTLLIKYLAIIMLLTPFLGLCNYTRQFRKPFRNEQD